MPPPSPAPSRSRGSLLGMLALLSVITYIDRICISVAGPRIQRDLGLAPEQWGWVLGAFLASYGLFAIPCGLAGDRIGPRRMLPRVVLWWSLFTTLTGAAWSWAVLVGTQFFFGAGEAGAYPNITGVIGRNFPLSERARAQGVVWAASRVGGALSPLLIVPLLAWVGWRKTFFLCSGLGIIWVLIWAAWSRRRAGEEPEASPSAPARAAWEAMLRSREVRILVVLYWCYAWGSVFYLSWFPTYLVKGRGLTERQMGFLASLPFILGLIGNIAGGMAGDRLVRRLGLTAGRRLIGSLSLLGAAACLVITASTRGQAIGVFFLAIGFGVMDFMLPSAWSLCLDLGGPYAGAVSGAMNTAGSISGVLCTVCFGYMVKAFGSYNLPLYLIAAMVATAGLLFALIDPNRPISLAARSGDPSDAAAPTPAR